MSGLVGFMFGASASVVMLVVLRWLAGFPFGVRGLKDAIVPWAVASGNLRTARAAGGVAGWYLGAALSFAIASMVAGINILDETSMRVNVAVGGPAERAGIRKGDRVVAVEGDPIRDWDQLKSVIAKRTGEVTHVTIERDGAQSIIEAVPVAHADGRGRLMVGPYTETRSVGFGEALATGLGMPFDILRSTGKSFLRIFAGKEQVELSGPAQIASEVSKVPGIALGMRFAAALAAYVLPFIAFVSIALAFIRRSASKT